MTDAQRLHDEFVERFSTPPRLFRAPGRVNLIGEHTDYNDGFVMPMAISFATLVGVSRRPDARLVVRSADFDETCEVDLALADQPRSGPPGTVLWIDYVIGVAGALKRAGVELSGANLLIRSRVPSGAGLSSSAALEVSIALALTSLGTTTLDPVALAALCQEAENDYVGMRCGIMDQMTSACGRAEHALKIDCRSLQYELVPLRLLTDDATRAQLVVCNSMVRHQHAGGGYNRRRDECEEAVRLLKQMLPRISALRDVTPAVLQEHESMLDPVLFRRCRHVVTENERVERAAEALKAGDLRRFGGLMRESHRSMRDDYEISCPEIDLMVTLADSLDGVYGARMTGGGFGGCTVNLVRADRVSAFRETMTARYGAATGLTPEIYVCDAGAGAGPAFVEDPSTKESA